MNKAIVLLSGTPSGKRTFNEILQRNSWVWNINPKDFLYEKLFKSISYDGEKDEAFYKNLQEVSNLLNEKFEYERKYLKEKIGRFLQDTDEVKTHEGKTFNSFVLVAHGVSKGLVEYLKDEFGIFKIHIAPLNTNPNIENQDVILWEHADNFESKVESTLAILTKGDVKDG